MGWTELRPIQSDAIRAVLQSESDLIISAATASGKTEAAFLPIISRLAESPAQSVGALYISPLKALINDQFRRLEELCEYAEIPVHKWHGDVGQGAKAKLVKKPSGIVLTTPESLESMFVNRSSALPRLYNALDFVVIDELHAFVGRERGTHLRSLLHRLEQRIGRRFRILALSATLGEWSREYATWMRPEQADSVVVITSSDDEKTIHLKIYGYVVGEEALADETESDEEAPDTSHIVDDLLKAFGSRKSLIFANRKNDVELFADALNERCRRARTPQAFLVHHGSLSKEIREETELLMRGNVQFTTLCSSTLELGIDIGNVKAVGQLGAPWSVSSMIQRLGRSGREDEQPSEMRIFIEELPLGNDSGLIDRLHVDLLQAVALTELMLEKWLEPPEIACFDPSTLIQQILSVLTETGGVAAADLFQRLIGRGAFAGVNKSEFIELLRHLGDRSLVEQMAEGDLILGIEGERIVKSLEFYSAFASSKEFTVLHAGDAIGSISAIDPPPPHDHLLLAGRRWQVIDVDTQREEINVNPARGRKATPFTGSGGEIHDRVRATMKEIVLGTKPIPYLNQGALDWLREAREIAAAAGLDRTAWHEISPNTCLLFTWSGSRTQRTIVLFSRLAGIDAVDREVAIEFRAPQRVARHKLLAILRQGLSEDDLIDQEPFQERRKYDCFLPEALLRKSFAKNALNMTQCVSLLDGVCSDDCTT